GKHEGNTHLGTHASGVPLRLNSTPEACVPHQRITTLPQVKPPPNDAIKTMSSFLMRPASTHSSRPIGIEAEDVLPCFAMLENTFDCSTFNVFDTASVILWFA